MKNEIGRALWKYMGMDARMDLSPYVVGPGVITLALGLTVYVSLAWYFGWSRGWKLGVSVLAVIAFNAIVWLEYFEKWKDRKEQEKNKASPPSPRELDALLREFLESLSESLLSAGYTEEPVESHYLFVYQPGPSERSGGVHVMLAPRSDGRGHHIYNPVGYGAVLITAERMVYIGKAIDHFWEKRAAFCAYDITWDAVKDIVLMTDFREADGEPPGDQILVCLVLDYDDPPDSEDESEERPGSHQEVAEVLGHTDFRKVIYIPADLDVWGLEESPRTILALIDDMESHMRQFHGDAFRGIRTADGRAKEILAYLRKEFSDRGPDEAAQDGSSERTASARNADESGQSGPDTLQSRKTVKMTCPVCKVTINRPEGSKVRCPHCGAPL